MAIVTHAVSTPSTLNNQQTYSSGTFTNDENDLLLAFIFISAATPSVGSVSLNSSGGISFSLVNSGEHATGADRFYVFVSNSLVPQSASRSIIFDIGDDPTASGCLIQAARIAGMSRSGGLAIRQSVIDSNRTIGQNPPAFSPFSLNCLASNPVFGYVVCNQDLGTNPSFIQPSGFTEAVEDGYTTPDRGGTYVFRNSGFTGTVVTWLADAGTAYGDALVELDTSTITSPFFTTIDAKRI